MEKGMTCSFVGHRRFIVPKNLEEKLIDTIENLINNGVDSFLIGTHGDFDAFALKICMMLKRKYSYINITLIYTSISKLNDKFEDDYYRNSGVDRISYCIEDIYFKRKITESNKMMILNSDIVIAYVNKKEFQSGAKNSLRFAEKHSKRIINLY